MNVGITYCGGCNPRYQRKELVDRIKNALDGQVVFEKASEASNHDVLLVINGCSNACTHYSRFSGHHAVIQVKSDSDYAHVLNLITHYISQKS